MLLSAFFVRRIMSAEFTKTVRDNPRVERTLSLLPSVLLTIEGKCAMNQGKNRPGFGSFTTNLQDIDGGIPGLKRCCVDDEVSIPMIDAEIPHFGTVPNLVKASQEQRLCSSSVLEEKTRSTR
jgi:hypothetical protein